MIKEAIKTVTDQQDLTFEQAEQVIDEIMSGKAVDSQIASLLTALAMKHETIAEIAGSASAMRAHALQFDAQEPVLEIVGTGGDHSNSFNISTTSALVIAAAGTPVAKHGNRAASSRSGAADVLEALGVKIDVTPEASEAILHKIGICFLFAQEYHQAMKYVAPVRKSLGIHTLFNILGPLANPAGATMQLLGVYDQSLLEPMAHVLQQLGVKNAMVVHGADGLDEVSLTGPTQVCELQQGEFSSYAITPEQFGLKRCQPADLVGGTPADNAQITRDILAGKKGPQRDVVLMNAGCALHIAHPELTLQQAIDLAAKTIDSGKAAAKLAAFIQLSQEAVAA
ncbi:MULTISPECIES: anthranilate phosphoribosyltransferase [Loigolactobacillus]|uniref:Anthranilate phosphoribosyltransferase n=1 Tax=Loigolactobacillus backii TaxID=375175 RepID=A0A192GZV5_9LACO|nr:MULTISPECIES: anthranilate phosphoribosyltransferase [Loigolactobacillus]ANK58810.1 anthranilate phosphoribosyltransferase [Loigolactobacillus backii]ANK61527.1 anthranilate phosphoribosyltransferase [Loigolactobacillus backii]ANK66248.1 anthranilate phosphoribosyltransferase [Loigolactobacillus backii]ANK69275.1 anthranilate phosphoribosyltransferase [Loigolactobacillus backii]MDA5388746.1 anthranilate phosphoribosyltransferase [Loigolactobacillus backii]